MLKLRFTHNISPNDPVPFSHYKNIKTRKHCKNPSQRLEQVLYETRSKRCSQQLAPPRVNETLNGLHGECANA